MMAVLLALALAQQSDLGRTNGDLSRSAPLQLLDESVRQGAISELNFAGEGVVCSRTSNRGNCSIDAGAAVGDIELNPTYQTQAALSLFVDKGGSDSNNCTTAPTACLTIGGALNKMPRFLAHSVTVRIDAGVYAENVSIQDFYARSGATVTIQGQSLVAVTPATGTATGTLTAFGATTTTTIGTMTDSAQAWTTNDLRGQFVRITSGAASGQRRAIVSNTATSLEFAGSFTSNPSAGATYQIETPSSVISGSTTVSGNIVHPTASSFITLSQLGFSATTSGSTLNTTACSSAVSLSDVRATSTVASGGVLNLNGFRPTGAVVATSATGVPLSVGGTTTANAIAAWGSNGNPAGYFIYSGTTNAVQMTVRSAAPMGPMNCGVLETGSASASVVSTVTGMPLMAQSGTTPTLFGFARCPAGSTGYGFSIGAPEVFGYSNRSQFQLHGPFAVINCAVGLMVHGTAQVVGRSLAFVSTTTGVAVQKGGGFNTNLSPTFSDVTNEFTIDGVPFAWTDMNNLSPQSFVSNPNTLSHIDLY